MKVDENIKLKEENEKLKGTLTKVGEIMGQKWQFC